MNNLDDLQKKLSNLNEDVVSASHPRSLPLKELLNPAFMRRFTRFPCVDDFFENSGIPIESQEDFDRLGGDTMDAFVQSTTDFSSWDEMLEEAAAEYLSDNLIF